MNFDGVMVAASVFGLGAVLVHVFLFLARMSAEIRRLRRDLTKIESQLDSCKTTRGGLLIPPRPEDPGLDAEPVTYREAIAKYPLPRRG